MEENEGCNLCLHCVRTTSEKGGPENITYSELSVPEVCNHWICSEKVRIAEYERNYKEMMKAEYAEFLVTRGHTEKKYLS